MSQLSASSRAALIKEFANVPPTCPMWPTPPAGKRALLTVNTAATLKSFTIHYKGQVVNTSPQKFRLWVKGQAASTTSPAHSIANYALN